MDLTCKQCGARFRAAIPEPLTRAVRVACPSCKNQMVLKPAASAAQPRDERPATLHDTPLPQKRRRIAVIADEPRPFRAFLAEHLRRLGFDVTMFESGEPALEFVRRA